MKTELFILYQRRSADVIRFSKGRIFVRSLALAVIVEIAEYGDIDRVQVQLGG